MNTKSFILVVIMLAFAASLAFGGAGELNFVQKIWATVNTNLNGTITSRASATDYTAARAVKIDNLDAAITTRAASATALTTAMWTDARAAKLDDVVLDAGQKLLRVTNTGTTTYTLLNYTGAGILHNIFVKFQAESGVAVQWTISANIDGQGAQTIAMIPYNGNIFSANIDNAVFYYGEVAHDYATIQIPLYVRFKTSCVVTFTKDSGTSHGLYSTAIYSTDI